MGKNEGREISLVLITAIELLFEFIAVASIWGAWYFIDFQQKVNDLPSLSKYVLALTEWSLAHWHLFVLIIAIQGGVSVIRYRIIPRNPQTRMLKLIDEFWSFAVTMTASAIIFFCCIGVLVLFSVGPVEIK